MNVPFPFLSQLKFYTSFFFHKIYIFTDTKKGKWNLLWADILWVLRPVTNIDPHAMWPIKEDYYETKLGNFYIYPDLQNTISISPAFEKHDFDFLITILSQQLKKRKKILFLDIGAQFGDYCIKIAKIFRQYKNLDIIAFEPNANNFLGDSYKLLKKNIVLNNVNGIKTYPIGLGDKKTKTKNKFGITTQRLDHVLKPSLIKKYDCIVMKMDIEGFETEALKGSQGIIDNAKEVYLLVEDIVDKRLPKTLSKDFVFIKKLTPYNSFWKKI